jgi:hypothetical protein
MIPLVKGPENPISLIYSTCLLQFEEDFNKFLALDETIVNSVMQIDEMVKCVSGVSKLKLSIGK